MRYALIFLIFLFFLPACAFVGGRYTGLRHEAVPESARSVLAELIHDNATIKPFKGIGRVRFTADHREWSARLAWIAKPAGQLRMEMISFTGQPMAKLVCNGKDAFFYWPDKGCYHKQRLGRSPLKSLIGIPVGVNNLIALLGGGVPVYPHDSIAVRKNGGHRGNVISLKRKWQGVVEKIIMAPDPSTVHQIDVYNWRHLLYRIVVESDMVTGGRRVPSVLRITDDSGHVLLLSVDRSWWDVSIPRDAFVVRLPAQDKCK